MKNQHVKNQPMRILALLAILLALSCFCGLMVAAAGANEAPTPVFTANAGITYDNATGAWVKEYDGESTIDVSDVKIAVGANVYDVTSASFESADAGTQKIILTYTEGGEVKTLRVPARIDPVEVGFVGGASASITYNPESSMYENVAVDYTNVSLDEAAIAAGLEIDKVGTVSVNTAEIANGTVTAYAQVTLKAASGANLNVNNYKVPLLPVTVKVNAITLSDVAWSNNGAYSFTYGNSVIDADGNKIPECLAITATATTADGVAVPLQVVVVVGDNVYTLAEAYALGYYGNVYAGNREENYTLEVRTPNSELYVLNTENEKLTAVVTIKQAVYNVSISNKTFLGEADMTNPNKIEPMRYQILVEGAGVPADILSKITYTYYDSKDNAYKNGVSAPGIYTVYATMPALVEGGFENYRFNVSELRATLTIKRNYVIRGDKENNAQIVVVGSNGIADSVKVEFKVPAELDRKAVRGFKVYQGYNIAISGANNEKFTLMIPVPSAMISNDRCEPLTVKDLYLYDGAGNMVSATEKYTVKLSDNGAYYIVEGFSTASEVTFVIAPAYNAPFFATPLGIVLIILLVLLILLAMVSIGLKLRQIERSKKADEYTIDTEGDVPAYAPVEAEEKIEDVDACIDEGIDNLADELANEESTEEAPADADATAEVEDAIDDVLAEAAEETLEVEEDTAADEATEAMAEDIAENLEETTEAEEEVVDVADEVEAAVADAMEENLNESADAAAAVAIIAEDEDDDEDEDGAFGGFTSGLTYIDVAAEPETYADMLEREARGEIQIVYRYRRSYQSRLAQSQGSVQDYYNIIKNTFLSYKGIKSRISWNYEAFNLGRTHVAKFNAKTRTLYLYMALDPAALTDTKYGFVDMSEKKKYASVPVLMKIKGDRKFKHALELVTKLCEETLGLAKKKVVEEVDYKLPYMTTDALVAEGLVKKLAAEIPMALLTGEADADVTAAPVAEEAVVEETVVEEAPAEEIPAAAPAADEDATNV